MKEKITCFVLIHQVPFFPCIKKTQTTLQFHVNNVVKKRHLLYSILVPTLLILQQGII